MAKPSGPIAILGIALGMHLAGATAARAAETWRCGNTYTDQPCAGGKPVAVEDARSPNAASENEAQTRRAAAAADRMERDRRRQEQIAARQQPTVFENKPRTASFVQPATAASMGRGKKKKGANKEPEFFTAHDAQAAAAATPTKKKKKVENASAD